MTAQTEEVAPDLGRDLDARSTPEQVLKSIVDGINTGNLDRLLTLYEPEAAFATQPGDLSRGLAGVHRALALAGADVATIPPAVIYKLADHPLTKSGLEQFVKDWKATGQSIL